MLCFFASSVFPAMGFGKSSNSFDICSPARLRVYQHGANVEPHFVTCLYIFFRFSSATGRPFFCLMIFRTVASLSSSQGGEGKSDPRQDGSRRNVRGGWTRFAAMGRQRCQAAIAVLCGVVLLNLWGHCVDSGLYGYIHIFLYTIYVHYIYLHIYIYCIFSMYVLYVSQNFQELNEHFLIPMGGAIHHDSRPRSLKPHPLERLEAWMWKTLPVSLGNIYISGGFSISM